MKARLLALLGVLSVFSISAIRASGQTQRPNILLIVADDLGEMDMGFNNPNTFYETPNLDKLARQGTRFTEGYSASPVCSPSRYALQTGKYPARSGLTDYLPGGQSQRFKPAPVTQQMSLREVTLAKALKPAGYTTAFVGKWHLGAEPVYWPEGQGYDINFAGCDMGHPADYFVPYKNPRLKDGPPGEYLPQRLASEAIGLLERFKRDGKPFFMCYCDYLVHTPLQAPESLIAKYRDKAVREGRSPTGRFGTEAQYDLIKQPRKVRLEQGLPVYSAMVESLDTALGRVLAKLDELGLADNTLVIFTADNGGVSTSEGYPTSNLPFRGGKGWMYEGGIREPFLVRWPGHVPAGAVRASPVIGVDVYPTVLEAAAVPTPAGVHLDGRSVLAAARGEMEAERDLFWHYPHYSPQGGFPASAVRSGALKLIEDLEDGRLFLYNIESDPGELHDLASAMPKEVLQLQARLAAWQRETGAKFLRPRPGGSEPWHPSWQSTSAGDSVAQSGFLVRLEPWQRSIADD